jgi:hypothetical protein
VLYQLDLNGQQAFAVRSRTAAGGEYLLLSQTGSGTPPAGWRDSAWNPDTRMEFFSEQYNGFPVLGFRNVQGPASAMLFTPQLVAPAGVVRLRLDYASPRADSLLVRFKPADGPAWDVKPLPGTGGGWRVETMTVDLKGTAGRFEFHNRDGSPDDAARIRGLSVTEVGASPPGPRATAAVFKFDTSRIAPFRATKEWTRLTDGGAPALPPGVAFQCWKRDATAEFRCEEVAGGRALGIANLSDGKSGQFGFELETAMGVSLKPGTAYQVKIEYFTRNDASGWLSVQTADTKPLASGPLRNSAGQWKTAVVPFTRGEQQVRLTVENIATGEGNTLLFRGFEIHEAPAAAALASPPATPLYAVTFDGVPTFRKSVEQGAAVGGLDRLPPHVSGFFRQSGATGEFRVEVIDGSKAVGITNFTDLKSGQLTVAFEEVPGGNLIPGRSYLARISYRTANDGAGKFDVQGGGPGYRRYGSTDLTPSDTWRTAEVPFTRPDEKLSVVVDNTAVGEGNALYVRSIEVLEVAGTK